MRARRLRDTSRRCGGRLAGSFVASTTAGSRWASRARLTLASGSEPESDVAVFERAAPQPYHPASAALVIEVAVSSSARDLTAKPAIHAAAGVAEYWVVDLEAARVVVHRTPAEQRYAERFDVTADATLTPSAVAVEPLALREIFGADA